MANTAHPLRVSFASDPDEQLVHPDVWAPRPRLRLVPPLAGGAATADPDDAVEPARSGDLAP